MERIGNYHLQGELGRGNMGVVYRAHDPTLDRPVAIKVLLHTALAHEADLDRFRKEAQALARLRHPNIVAIHSAGEVKGKPYLAMDLLEGEPLSDRLRRAGTLEADEAVRIVERLAAALHYAHQRGVLHRDVKPANVLLDGEGSPFLTDFGLARMLGNDQRVTATGEILGTPAYMSPEQANGEQERIGPRSDVYSLGATLYHLLTGAPPFQGASVIQTLDRVLTREPEPPSAIRIDLDPALEAICMKCLAKDPQERFQTAAALGAALSAWNPHTPSRNMGFLLPGVVGLLVGLAGVAVLAWELAHTREELRAARDELQVTRDELERAQATPPPATTPPPAEAKTKVFLSDSHQKVVGAWRIRPPRPLCRSAGETRPSC